MEYTEQPDRRLVALTLAALVLVPGVIAAELYVPGLQPKFSAGGTLKPSGGGPGPAKGTVVAVVMPNTVSLVKSLNFQPANIVLVIGVNNSITWNNQDTTDHTVTFDKVPAGVTAASISSDVSPGDSFGPVTLGVAGTYHYKCQFHPAWMQGTIIVKA
jgi:plastocyanin